jgi:thioredoxin-like negative regulator of GroEL
MRDVEEAVLQHEVLLLYATRRDCPECRQLDRRMQRLSRRYPSVKAFHIDLDSMPYAASRYLIYEVPTALLYYRGKPTVKRVGVLDIRELSELISELNEHASSSTDHRSGT